jgi:nucleotide-binding universal stress UspA family protein
MFTRILVPLDGSELGERAVPVAARLARARDATVLLVRAITLPIAIARLYGPGFMPFDGASLADPEWQRAEAQDYLTRLAGQPDLAGIAVETHLPSGEATPAILRTIQEQQADLVVISSHGRTGLSRWVLGSVAQHIAHQSPVPVLVLRTAEATQELLLTHVSQPPRALVSLDGSLVAEAALGPAVDVVTALAFPKPAALHLVSVVNPLLPDLEGVPEAEVVQGVQAYLTRVGERVQREHAGQIVVTSSTITSSDIAGALIGLAEDREHAAESGAGTYDLMAMGTHGLTGLEHWALGSVTERVLHGTKLPMLIVRPTEAALAPTPEPAVQTRA